MSPSTSYGGLGSPAAYAAEIKRKKAAGIAFTDPAAAEAFQTANPGLFGGGAGATTRGPIFGALGAGPGSATGASPGASTGASYAGNLSWFGSPEAYAAEIKRKQAAGTPFSDPVAAAEFQAAYPALFAAGGTPATGAGLPGTLPVGALTGATGAGPGPTGALPNVGLPGVVGGGPISTAITPWNSATSPVYQALLEGYRAQVPEAVGAVREGWYGRGPGLGESTWSKSAQAEMAQKVLGQGVAQIPGIAQYETGLQESAIERAYREREYQTGLQESAADRAYRERQLAGQEGQTAWERGQREREFAAGQTRGAAATAEDTRRWEAEFGQSQRESQAQIARWVAEDKAAGLDDGFMEDTYTGMVNGLISKTLTFQQAQAIIEGAVANGNCSRAEADRLLTALNTFRTVARPQGR